MCILLRRIQPAREQAGSGMVERRRLRAMENPPYLTSLSTRADPSLFGIHVHAKRVRRQRVTYPMFLHARRRRALFRLKFPPSRR